MKRIILKLKQTQMLQNVHIHEKQIKNKFFTNTK